MHADAFATYRSTRVFGSLDGLRALSVLAVVWHHTAGHSAALPQLLRNGHHGVTLFFAISGFLIVTLLLRERDRTGRIDLRAFYMRRALRIFPLYYAVVAVYVVLVFLLERHSAAGKEFFGNLIFFLTYTSNWFVTLDGRVIFYFAWSLATEEQFYLLWPWAERFLKPARALALMVAVVFLVGAVQWRNPPGGADAAGWLRLVQGVSLAICIGVVTAHAFHHETTYRWLFRVFGSRASSSGFGALAIAALALGWPQPIIHLCLALLVGACVYREDHWLGPLLQWRVLAFIGSVSYGIYLLHMLVKNFVLKLTDLVGWVPLSAGLLFVLTAVGAVGAAALSFRYFESYFLRKKTRFSRSGPSGK